MILLGFELYIRNVWRCDFLFRSLLLTNVNIAEVGGHSVPLAPFDEPLGVGLCEVMLYVLCK